LTERVILKVREHCLRKMGRRVVALEVDTKRSQHLNLYAKTHLLSKNQSSKTYCLQKVTRIILRNSWSLRHLSNSQTGKLQANKMGQ